MADIDLGLLWHIADHASGEDVRALIARIRELEGALLKVAQMAEALKKDCGMNPESRQAIRNGEYMKISYAARAAIDAARKEKGHG